MNHTADSYRKEWAALTGRPEGEIYVPEDIREEGDRKPSPTPPDVKGRGARR